MVVYPDGKILFECEYIMNTNQNNFINAKSAYSCVSHTSNL